MFILEQNDKFRPIFDGREINKYINVPNVTYDQLRDVGLMFEDGLTSIAFDLLSGFHAVSLAEEVRPYFGIVIENQYYCFNILPFRLCTAPLVFTLFTRHLVKLLR
jgi:hypothetical protein